MIKEVFIDKNKSALKELFNKLPANTDIYGYFYLLCAHKKIEKQGAVNIFLGSSHSTYMVIEKMFKKSTVNLSINSQDIYYSFLNIRKAVEESKRSVKRCFLVLGWYNIHRDLSLSKSPTGITAFNIESAIFKDYHHYQGEISYDPWEDVRKEYPDPEEFEYAKEFIMKLWNKYFEDVGSYYNTKRSPRRSVIYDEMDWKSLSQEDREKFGVVRAADHNKGMKYIETIKENIVLLHKMIEYIASEGIEPIVIIPPYTKEYNDNIAPELKNMLDIVLQNSPVPVPTLDMNKLNVWKDNDFVDTDHLSEKGAQKATQIIIQTFCRDD